MSKVSLSDLTVKNLPLPVKGQARYWDASLPGFGIRVSQGGAKTWIVLDPRSKVRTQETIGRYPLISLQDARSEAKRLLAEKTLGKHRARSLPWDVARDEYLAEVKERRKPRTHTDYKRILMTRFKFAGTKLSEVTPQDIQAKLRKIDYAPAEQQHAFVVARAFFNWAHQKHYVDTSPMARMKPPHSYKPRARILTDEEIAKVWNACGDDTFSSIVKLLILTGLRKGEAKHLTRDMIQGDRVVLPPWLTKNSREHVFPLPSTVSALLGAFPNTDGPILGVPVGEERKPFSAWSKNKAKLDTRSGVTNWTLHDLRRSTASGLAGLGTPIQVVEKLLNHVSGSFSGIVGVYQRYDFFPEMSEALDKWECHILKLSAAVA